MVRVWVSLCHDVQTRFVHVVFVVIMLALLLCGRGANANDADLVPSLATQSNPVTLELDARRAPMGIMQTHLTIPVAPGAFTLVYPQWIPGEEGPTGPLNDLAALTITANGTSLPWRRDAVDFYAFHFQVPAGVRTVHVDFDVLMNRPGRTMATGNIAIVHWNRTLLYQEAVNAHDVFVKASIELPDGWDYGTALPGARRIDNRIEFAEVPLDMLVDSPLDCGRYVKHVVLWSGGDTENVLDAFADAPQNLDFPSSIISPYKALTPEAFALYGARHFNDYHFLLTLSDVIEGDGIEHHQSSDNRAAAEYMTNPAYQLETTLLPHEFSHSWNGKYRQPIGLAIPNYQVPMKTDLLWVYEGMNEYLGDVLSFRSGIRDPKRFPEYLAYLYARLDAEPGRLTDPLIDTAVASPYLFRAQGDYPSIRRTGGDYYTEGALLWLDVDTIIRQFSHGAKSLDTFEQLFAGPPDSGPITITYTREQLESLLHQVEPYDWHAFFEQHVYEVSTHPPTDEFARAGWRLVFTSTPNDYLTSQQLTHKENTDAWFSLGLRIDEAGVIQDVREGSPAWDAALVPGAKIAAIDNQAYDQKVLTSALISSQHSTAPIAILVARAGWYTTHLVKYHGGPRYPHLERIQGTPDMLASILAPHRVVSR